MNEHLDHMPCGFFTLSNGGDLLSCNQTLGKLLGYDVDALVGQHVNVMLAESAKAFIQLYFFPLITMQHYVEEMYLSLESKCGKEIPVLLNASLQNDIEKQVITCVIIPMRKRDEYENQLLIARKVAEEALKEKAKVHANLEETHYNLQENQMRLLKVNRQNQQFKTDIQNELELAKKIQEKSLTEAVSNDCIEIDSHYHASRELSGDNYGFYQINDHQYGAILLDVMGNGISSALISMSLHPLFQRLITKGFTADVVIEELDSYLHTLFYNNQESWHYCTAIYMIIDTDKQTVECTNAGHPPAILQNELGVQQECHSTSPPIGAFEGLMFKTNTFTYEKNSRIFLYTDGVSEAIGETDLRILLKESASEPMSQVKNHILELLQIKEENQYRDDDQCFILIDLK